MNTSISQTAETGHPSPLRYAGCDSTTAIRYRSDVDAVRVFPCKTETHDDAETVFERAGPRAQLIGEPEKMTAAILTCGGLCPGLNDVLRGLVMSLSHHYGVPRILGIRYGYAGLTDGGLSPWELTPDSVDEIHRDGGTMLGTSRGAQNVGEMADWILKQGITQLYIIGGDGTQRGALELSQELARRARPVNVIGIPKTVDNDIMWVDQSFGYDTAVEIAARVISDAHVEARSTERGVGIVKVMGRDSGFIAAGAAIASQEANVVLVPEVEFDFDGPNGLLTYLEKRLERKDHVVIVVAEGAGQRHFKQQGREVKDASGNVLHRDIGELLCERIHRHFQTLEKPVKLKYLDPGYSVRSAPACATDRIYCTRLAHAAVHAAMAGRTAMMVSRWSGHYVHVPLELVTKGRRRIDPTGSLWRTVLEATGQPCLNHGEGRC
ncbi:ATP-dependent 6-phosphofructokinase [Pontiella agarivorans]|uniref:ATP-dependent 6-phosphofructokinase n=1 Tax=Pontiella agarivorans TaxID=3038953 RepID=A0ABU5MV25_9BACT|nr:ATP-dependent 6-phosphofructokinase [Pontiella agarivorans]MDZ8118062.1 ATP-dependent 6-phosphofructokinase [Pontiella agarivorans]